MPESGAGRPVGAGHDWRTVLDATWRADAGRLHAGIVARFRRLDLAEDAVAEAMGRATARWPVDGVPEHPGGWLATVAGRWAQDRLRAEAMHRRKLPLLAVEQRERNGDLRGPDPGDRGVPVAGRAGRCR